MQTSKFTTNEATEASVVICSYCSSPNPPSRCSRCKFAYYCNRKCQANHWKIHKTKCNKAKQRFKIQHHIDSNKFATAFAKLYQDKHEDNISQSPSYSSIFTEIEHCRVSNCESVKRVINALLKYQNIIKISSKPEHGHRQQLPIQIFTDYLLTKYPEFLNDLNHVYIKHEYDIEEIQKIFTQHSQYELCDIHKCQISNRHCNILEDEDSNNLDPLYDVHKQIWDATHFYFNHLFELGLRRPVAEKENDSKYTYDQNDTWNLIDNKMNKRWSILKQKRKKFSRFYGRFESDSNKFIIKHKPGFQKMPSQTSLLPLVELGNYLRIRWYESQSLIYPLSLHVVRSEEDGGLTVIDDLIEYIFGIDAINGEEANLFMTMINEEEYETESISMDVQSVKSNIILTCSHATSTSGIIESNINAYFQQQKRIFILRLSPYMILVLLLCFSI